MANKYTDAVFHAKVPAVDKAVLWAIAHRSNNETGACYPSVRTVSKEGGASTTIVKAVIAYAASIGILERKIRKDGNVCLANEYTFSLTNLQWLTRADSRFNPDGETDTGVRATLGKLPAQAVSQSTGGVVSGPRVYKRPAQGWGGSRLKNSEVDLRIGTQKLISDKAEDTSFADTFGETQGDPVNPQTLVNRLKEIVTDKEWTVSEQDLNDIQRSQNGKGHLVLPAISWFLDENDALRLSTHFPKLPLQKRKSMITDFRRGFLNNIPTILSTYEKQIPSSASPLDKSKAFEIED